MAILASFDFRSYDGVKFEVFPKSTTGDDLLTWCFIIFNIGRSIIKAMAATEDINENRNGELGIKSKVFLMLSYFVQIAQRVVIITSVSNMGIESLVFVSNDIFFNIQIQPPKYQQSTILMILLPIIFRWFSLFLFYVCICPCVHRLGETNIRFKSMSLMDKIIHIVSNTFGVKSLSNTHQKPYINLETGILHLLSLIDFVFYALCLFFLPVDQVHLIITGIFPTIILGLLLGLLFHCLAYKVSVFN